ncbi:MAG: copper amine oxidase N-terminal domain-containing protein [Syntrophomonadaceae bacterium]
MHLFKKKTILLWTLVLAAALLVPGLYFPATAAAATTPRIVDQNEDVHADYVTLQAEINLYSSNYHITEYGFYHNSDKVDRQYHEGPDSQWVKVGGGADELGPGDTFMYDLSRDAMEDVPGFDGHEPYYYRAYVIYEDLDFGFQRVSYGLFRSFQPDSQTAPTVSTLAPTGIDSDSATLNGEIVDFGGDKAITEYGFYYGTTSSPSSKKMVGDADDSIGEGDDFSWDVTGLQTNTRYYFRAYARNRQGIAYGTVKSFLTTADQRVPKVTTAAATGIEADAATLNGKIVDFGDDDKITEYGFYYGTTSSPSTKKVVGDSRDSIDEGDEFEYELTGLTVDTKYYFQAYARNRRGTAYGTIKYFVTEANRKPRVTTLPNTFGEDWARFNGIITDKGESQVKSYGFYYGLTSSTPNRIEVGRSIDEDQEFSYRVTGLQPDTLYYVKAYATNNQGTTYGYLNNFSTQAPLQSKNSVFTIGSAYYTLRGSSQWMDVAPYIRNGRTYMPIRYVAYAMGLTDADIVWDEATRTVILTKEQTRVTLIIGSRNIYINGSPMLMDVPPEITNSRTCLPIAWVARAFGYNAVWDAWARTVTIQ